MPERPAILVVEDDPTIAGLMGTLLRREGFEPAVLHDGRAALRHLASQAPAALAVLDVMLPYTDGLSVLHAMRCDQAWREVPVIVLSARTQPADVARAEAAGANAVLAKPFRPQVLVEAVRSLIAGRAA